VSNSASSMGGLDDASLRVLFEHHHRELPLLNASSTDHSTGKSLEISPALVAEETDPAEATELPKWMLDYFDWHAQQLLELNESNWRKHKFLVMHCLLTDIYCGGAADRLTKIPTAVLLAAQYHRILFIKWERPAALEEFLLPARLNWSIPVWLDQEMSFIRKAHIVSSLHFERYMNDTALLIQMKHQSSDHGAAYYDDHQLPHEPAFAQVFSQCWHAVFQPSPPVAALVAQAQEQLGLTGTYVAVHIRAKYQADKSRKYALAQNAVNCGTQLRPTAPIFISSDSLPVVQFAVKYGAKRGGTVLARSQDKAPLHLDRGSHYLSSKNADWSLYPPSAYYDVFVDLFLIANSACVAFNVGGFGRWGNLLSKNATCKMNHSTSACLWNGGGRSSWHM
jgi:hypothetical protein